MTTEEQLRDLMIKKSGSVNKFAQECGLSQSTIFTIFQRGVGKANVSSIITICKALGISADRLAEGEIVPISLPDISVSPDILIEFSKLSDNSQEQVMSYIKFLLDQEDKK